MGPPFDEGSSTLGRSRDHGLAWGRSWRTRVASAALFGIVAVLGATACKSREVEALERAAADVGAIQWNDGQDAAAKLRLLQALQAAIDRLPSIKAAEAARVKGNEALQRALVAGLAQPLMVRLERQLRADVGEGQMGYDALKTYLLLGDPPRAKTFQPWLTRTLLQRTSDELRPWSKASPEELRELLASVWLSYLDALVSGAVTPEPLDASLVQQVRDIRRRVGGNQRFYAQLVGTLGEAKIDPGSAAEGDNLLYSPVSLKALFADQPAVLTVLRSKRFQSESTWLLVEGPYTAKGYEAVQRAMKERLETELSDGWVLLDDAKAEAEHERRIRVSLARVQVDYEQQYVSQWRDFLLDIEVAPAKNDQELARHLEILATEPCPLGRILQVLRDNTEAVVRPKSGSPSGAQELEPGEVIRTTFASMVAFAAQGEGSGLGQYHAAIRSAHDKLAMGDRAGVKEAEKKTRELLWKLDNPGQLYLGPLLLAPLGAK